MLKLRDHSRVHNDHGDIRPKPCVPLNVQYFTPEENRTLFIDFYYTFREQEEFDNAESGRDTPPAHLHDIYKRYVQEWYKTMENIRTGTVIVQPREKKSKQVNSCMDYHMFFRILEKYDDEYMCGQQSPTAKIDRSKDMVRMVDQGGIPRLHDPWYFQDNTPSNPVLRFEKHSQH